MRGKGLFALLTRLASARSDSSETRRARAKRSGRRQVGFFLCFDHVFFDCAKKGGPFYYI